MKSKGHKRAAVIDIGSNSIKLIIGEENGNNISVLESLKSIVPFARQAFYKGRVSHDAINQTLCILEKYKQLLKGYEITDVRVVATTAIREARNRDIFIDTIFRKTGLDIEVLNTGDVVNYLDSFLSQKLSNRYPINSKNVIIAELGSGSLDISLMGKGYPMMNIGLPIGTMRLKQLMDAIQGSVSEGFDAAKEAIDNEFSYLNRSLSTIPFDDIILIDETYSFYLQNILPEKNIESNFFILNRDESKLILDRVAEKNPEDIATDYDIPEEIAEVISQYGLILYNLFTLGNRENIFILEASLSEAILTGMLLKKEISRKISRKKQLVSMAIFICKKYGLDVEHAYQVARLSSILFKSLSWQMGLKSTDLIYLTLASYLHDIGLFIHNRAHHKHTEYIISTLDLFGLSEQEMRIIATTARYHRKGAPVTRHLLYGSMPKESQLLVQKLSAILRIANALDRSHKQKVKSISVRFNRENEITLFATVKGSIVLEKMDFIEKKDLFEDITGCKINLIVQDEN